MSRWTMGFTERMAGEYTGRKPGFPGGRFHFEVEFDSDRFSLREVAGRAAGWLTMEGVAADAPAEGTMEISPIWKRRIGYVLEFAGQDGHRFRFAGEKRIDWLRPVRTWTTLPGTVTDLATGEIVGDVVVRFDARRDLGALLKSYRFRRTPALAEAAPAQPLAVVPEEAGEALPLGGHVRRTA